MSEYSYRFPDFTKESVHEVVTQHWDLSGPVPLPKFNPTCMVCGHDEILCKHWRFFVRTENRRSSNPYRCDVGMKCTACSAVWQHGLVVPEDYHPGKRRIILWREVKENLNNPNYNI